MIQTFDFLPLVWKSEELKNRLLLMMEEQKEQEIAIEVYTLTFDFERQIVRITCNDPDYLFYCKIIPAEMKIDSLKCQIHREAGSMIECTWI